LDIKPRTLVVLDIDETILKFPSIKKGWWTETFNRYYEIYLDYNKAEEKALHDWENLVIKDKAQLLDSDYFESFINKINDSNSELILLTARNDKLKELTKKHLIDCDINIPSHRIYHDRNKGKKLLDLVTNIYTNTSQIIFVDDLESNVINVHETFSGTLHNINIYLIDHEKN
jgi:hypothetical protein